MTIIDSLVMDGTVAWIALGVLGLELALLFMLSGRRRPMAPYVANALSGMFLILALRAALIGAGSTTVALMLGLGFVAHLIELALRLRGKVP